MSDFNVTQALTKTFYEALHSYHEGGLTNGGGVAGLQRPQLDRFDASGTQVLPSDVPAAQSQKSDWRDPKSMTQWSQVAGRWKPTFTAPPDDPALSSYLEGLAEKLAAQPGVSYMVPSYLQGKIDAAEVTRTEQAFAAENYPSDFRQESDGLQQIRDQIRGDIAHAAAGVVEQNPAGYLDTALGMIHDDRVKSAVRLALTDAQNNVDGGQSQFFTAPSSSTGKFHPADEINRGGLALHSLRDVEMGDHLCGIYNITGLERDEILGALAVHDIEKGGSPWNGYAGDHGPQGESYLDHIWNVAPGTPDDVAHPERHMSVLVGRHMAQWNAAPPAPGKKYGAKDPRVPRNLDEQIVSWGDYLGALDNVYLDAPK